MAMSHVFRKASPTIVPHAIRAISSARIVLHGKNEGSFHSQQFSTVADVDQNLVKVLKSRIKWWKSQIPVAPDFPFKIEDDRSAIKLERELGEEKIEVFVTNLRFSEGDNNNNNKDDKNDTVNDNKSSSSTDDDDTDSDSDSDSDDNSTSSDSTSDSDSDDNSASSDDDEIDGDDDKKSSDDPSSNEEGQNGNTKNPSLGCVPLKVNISKKDGTVMKIEVLGSVDGIIIENIEIYNRKNHSAHAPPKLEELGIDVLNSIMEYIGARGINKTNVDFLLKYMARKPDQSNIDQVLYERHLRFLENFKQFVSL